MSFTAFLLVCIAVLNAWIGLYVYKRNPRAAPNRAFVLMAVTIAFWTTGLAIAHYGPSGNAWALRVAFASASLIPIAVLAFAESTPYQFVDTYRLRQWLFSPLAVMLFVISFSPWIVVSVTATANGSTTTYGPLHSFFAIFVVACFGYAVYVLLAKYRAATGLAKLQIRHLLLALAIPSGLATFTNLIVPLVFNTSSLSRFGPFFTVPMLAFIGHSIIRHRLLHVRVVVRQSAAYLAAFCVAGIVLVAVLSASNAIISDNSSVPVRETLLAIAVAVLFGPVKGGLQRALDRYLYRAPYNYQRTIGEASRAFRSTIDLNVLVDHLTSLVDHTFRPEGVAIYLFDEDDAVFRLMKAYPPDRAPDILQASSAIVAATLKKREMFFRDDMVNARSNGDHLLEEELKRVDADVVAPLIAEQDVVGFISMGQKRSGDPYYSDDADLLATLANQASVAIRNAQAHERVVQLNKKLETILSTIESGVVAVSAKGKITLFNCAAERLTGTAADAVRGRLLDQLPAPLAGWIASTIADGQPCSQMEFALPDGAGQLVPLVCSTSPLVNPAGQLVGAVAVINDISHLKALEHERRRAERLASIEAIASGLVHEIRNPLVAIKTFFQLLPTRHHDPEFRETFARTADRELRRIDTLLTRFRTLASASSQPMEAVDIRDPIRHTLELIQPQLEDQHVRVRQVADGTPRPILGNVSQLEQLFLNLCLNAIEAMASGGELTVRVADLADGGGTTLMVEVSDTGCGIPEDLLTKLFNPFITTKARGSGLGLAICRSIVDAHRARLSARNNLERPGSTFTIEFPVPVAAPSPTATTA